MHSFSISSFNSDYTYGIHVSVPEEPAPADGFPVVYVLDGLSYFYLLRDAVRLQCRNAPRTGVEAAIVVGICHEEDSMRMRRFYDFTAPATEYSYPKRMASRIPDKVGGGADFQRFIEEELKPKIEAEYPVNRKKQTLFGHSLGGYFVLWNLLNAASYQNYIAISPSLWWNDHELMKQSLKQDQQGHRLFIAAGEKEGFMVEDARLFAENLRSSKLAIDYYMAEEENHASVVPTVMSRALRFVCGSF